MVASLIGAGIGAIGNVLGGLIGSSSAQKQHEDQMQFAWSSAMNKIRWTVNDAKRSGIHPLAALGSPVSSPMGTPVGASSASLGDAIGRAAELLANGINGKAAIERAEERDQLENELLRAQIGHSNAETSALLTDAQSRSMIAKTRAAAIGGPSAKIQNMFGPDIPINPKMNQRQRDMEDRYGDIDVGGVQNLLQDIIDGKYGGIKWKEKPLTNGGGGW